MPDIQTSAYSVPVTDLPDNNLPSIHDVVALIPAYNEEMVIAGVVLQAQQYVDQVIVVDDGSKDKTAALAKLAGAHVVRMETNMGKAHALMYGFDLAKQMGYSVVVMIDGDGQHDPNDIPRIVAPVLSGEADLVIGSRYLDRETKIPAYRQLGLTILNYTTRIATEGAKNHPSDTQSGFRGLSLTALNNLDFRSQGYSIESDMISHFLSRNLNIREVPISVSYDVPNTHKKHPLSHGFDVLSNIIGYIGYKRPLLFFLIPGAFLVSLSIMVGSLAFREYYLTTRLPFFMTIGCSLTLILGLMFVTSAFILNALVKIMAMQQR